MPALLEAVSGGTFSSNMLRYNCNYVAVNVMHQIKQNEKY